MLAIVGMAALLVPSGVPATTLQELSLATMVRQAEVIVTGTCTRVESRWLGRTLVTLATVSVSEALKGGERACCTLVVPGGVERLDRPIPIAVTYPGAPVVMRGQGLVLLLEPAAEVAGGFRSVGLLPGRAAGGEGPGGEDRPPAPRCQRRHLVPGRAKAEILNLLREQP